MPIVVEHGGRAGTTAGQMIGQAGQANLAREQRGMMQLRQLMQQREMQRTQIQAQSEMQMQAADIAMDQTALRAGLQREMQETDFVEQRQQMQESARLEAEQWETRYTAKDRQDIARLNNGKKLLMQNPNFSEEERAAAMRTIDMQIAGIEPSLIPRDPDKMTFQPGRGPQDQWIDEQSGASVALDRSNNIRTLVQPDKMPEALAAKAQMERENTLADKRMELEELTVTDARTDKESPKYSPAVVDSKLKRMYPWYHEQEIERNREAAQKAQASQAQQMDNIQQEQAQEQSNDYMLEEAERQGVKITERDIDLPAPVAIAQAQLREWQGRYGGYDGLPPKLRAAWREAKRIMEQYASGMQQQIQQGQQAPQVDVGQTVKSSRGREMLQGRGEFGGWN